MIFNAKQLYTRVVSLLMFPIFVLAMFLQAIIDGSCSFLESLALELEAIKQFYKDQFSNKYSLTVKDDIQDFWNAS